MFISPIPEPIDLSEDFEIREQVQAELLRRITEAPVDSRAALSDYVPSADEHQHKVIHAVMDWQDFHLYKIHRVAD